MSRLPPDAPNVTADAVNPEDRIAESFNRYFQNSGIRITPRDVRVGTRRLIRQHGWGIAFRVIADDGGSPSLEFYAGHRLTDDRHVLIWADGLCQRLDAISPWRFPYNPKVPGAKEVADEASREHTIRIITELRTKGIFPDPALFNGQPD